MEQALRNECSFLQKAESLLVVETGLQATMPLYFYTISFSFHSEFILFSQSLFIVN